MSVDLNASIKLGVNTLKSSASIIRKNVIESGRGEENPRVISLATRIILLLEKMADVLESISQRVSSAPEVVHLAPYTYIFQGERDEIVIMRTRPEHVVISVNSADNTVSLKSRRGVLEVSTNSLKIRARGVNIVLDLTSREQYEEKLSEIRNTLKIFESIVTRRLSILPRLRS
jgi:hypothetical protein